jgi:hypothetical protein
MKLTDTQLVLLSAALQREDRAVELPANLRGAGARKVIDKLLTQGLVEEVRARGALPVWRQDANAGSFALRITKPGLKAVDDTPDAKAAEAAANHVGGTKPDPTRADTRSSKPSRAKKSGKTAAAGKARRPRTESKQATVIAMLKRPKGATIPAIMSATGWQPHSVRGFFAAVVRKKLGLNLVSQKTDDGRVYGIVHGGRSDRTIADRPAARRS